MANYARQKNDILSFLDDAIASGDLRELLISPVRAQPRREVIYISEDAIYVYTTE